MQEVNSNLFINPGTDLTERDRELKTVINLSREQLKNRWQSQQGQYIISRWKAHGFERSVVDEMVGKFHGHTDLRGIPLKSEIFRGVDLSRIDFFSADFEGAELNAVNLTDTWLSDCDLRKTTFKWCIMRGVLIDGVDFDNRTSFLGIDLNTINFNLAALLQESALGEQRIQHIKRSNPAFSLVLRITCDYGRSFSRFLGCCISIIAAFGLAFFFVPNSLNTTDIGECIFYSFTAFIKVSSKDVYFVSTLGKLLFVVEASFGYIMLGILVAIIIRKTIGR